MQTNAVIEKMNPQAVAYGGRRGGWCDDGAMRAYWRQTKDSKPKSKDYRKARRLKEREKSLVGS